MDATIRDLERKVSEGDHGARGPLAARYLGLGRKKEALEIITPLFEALPSDQLVEECYLASGGFYVEEIGRKKFGIRAHNLSINGSLFTIDWEREPVYRGEYAW